LLKKGKKNRPQTRLLFLQFAAKRAIIFTVAWGEPVITLWRQYGALAQLVARYIRIVEVSGSNPLCSTKKDITRAPGLS
jgi:hypothetical protein